MEIRDYINQCLLRPGFQVSEAHQQGDGSLELVIEGECETHQHTLQAFEVEQIEKSASERKC